MLLSDWSEDPGISSGLGGLVSHQRIKGREQREKLKYYELQLKCLTDVGLLLMGTAFLHQSRGSPSLVPRLLPQLTVG